MGVADGVGAGVGVGVTLDGTMVTGPDAPPWPRWARLATVTVHQRVPAQGGAGEQQSHGRRGRDRTSHGRERPDK